MSTITELRDAIQGMVAAGWAAEPLTQALPLLWDDVEGEKPGHDVAGRPTAYGRSTVRHLSAQTESIGLGDGIGKEQHNGQLVVQVFMPRGTGYAGADAVAQAVKRFFQRQRIPGIDGWFTGVEAIEVPTTGPWTQTNIVAPFRYTEVVA